jgi:tetratricopeptide (TPR) repeat protein
VVVANYEELLHVVQIALQQRDYDACLSLLDSFLEEAEGADRVRALLAKSNVIYCVQPAWAAQGLALVDEALEQAQGNSQLVMWALGDALALCFVLGDVDKARRYEVSSHRLLQEHGSDSVIKVGRYRLHINMGLIAALRGEHPTAYWQFVQALSSLPQSDSEDQSVYARWAILINLYIANTCLEMGRIPESWEALDKAKALLSTENEKVQWTVLSAKILRQTGRPPEAQVALKSLPPDRTQFWNADNQARYHLVQALVAQDLGDLRQFHRHLALAHDIAVDNSLEYLLCEIQRTQRAPISLGVVR